MSLINEERSTVMAEASSQPINIVPPLRLPLPTQSPMRISGYLDEEGRRERIRRIQENLEREERILESLRE
jgi:hypothetical protein